MNPRGKASESQISRLYYNTLCNKNKNSLTLQISKGPVKVIQRLKIAHSFLQSVSDQFQVIVLSLSI